MIIFLPFIASICISYSIIFLFSRIDFLVNDNNLHGVQRSHESLVARIGGIPVFIGFSIGLFFIDDQSQSRYLLILWLASLPVLITGFYEDISAQVSPLIRLISAFLSIIIVFVWLDLGIFSLGFEWADYLLSSHVIVSLLFTLLVVGGAVNSLNIIDGFNGLLGGYSILVSLAIAYVAYTLGDNLVLQLSLSLCFSIIGFFILNFPFGKIFMGDGGAYFVGFMLAVIGLILVDRHEELSSWFLLLLFIYPMYELLYSIYRRKIIHKTDASQPDAKHLHSLVYLKFISCDLFKHNKIICNSMTSPPMWLLSLAGIIPAVVWNDNQAILIIFVFFFMVIYTIIYRFLAQTKLK